MSAVDDILSGIPMDQLAAQLGVDEATAESAAREAIPALLGGMQANAEDPAGAASLAGALGDHPSDLVDGGVDLNQVDADDGEKIVHNIFGPNTGEVVHTLGANTGQQQSLIAKLLPLLAPIVLAYLSKRISGSGKYGDLLGPLIAGAAGGAGGNVLTDILGGMLGGGRSAQPAEDEQPEQQSGGSILDILGNLLGAGRR